MSFFLSLVASLLTLSASQSPDCAVKRHVLLGSAMYGGSDNPLAMRTFHPAFEGGMPQLAGTHTVRQVVYNQGVQPTMQFGRQLDPRESCMLFDKDFLLRPEMYDDKEHAYSNMPSTKTTYSEWWTDMLHEDEDYFDVKSGLAYAAYKAIVDPARRSPELIRIVVVYARRAIALGEDNTFDPTADCKEGNMPSVQHLADAAADHNAHMIWVPVEDGAANDPFIKIAQSADYPRFHSVTRVRVRREIESIKANKAVLQTHVSVVFESTPNVQAVSNLMRDLWAGGLSEWHQGETWTIAYTRDIGPLCYIPSGTMSVVPPARVYLEEAPHPVQNDVGEEVTPLAHAILSALIKYGGHPARRGGFVIYVASRTKPTFNNGYTFSASCDGAKNPSWRLLEEKLIEYDARIVVVSGVMWDKTNDRVAYIQGNYNEVARQVEITYFNGEDTDEYATHLVYQAGYDDQTKSFASMYWKEPRLKEVFGSLSYTVSWDQSTDSIDYSGTCWIPRGFRDPFPVLGYDDIEEMVSTKPTGSSPMTFAILKAAASFRDRTPKAVLVSVGSDPVWGDQEDVDWRFYYCGDKLSPTKKEFERVLKDLNVRVFVMGLLYHNAPPGWFDVEGVTTVEWWRPDDTFYQAGITLIEAADDWGIPWAYVLHEGSSEQSSANVVAVVGDWQNADGDDSCLVGPNFRFTTPKALKYPAPPADGGAAFAMQSVENEYAGGALGAEFALYKMATGMKKGEVLVLMVERPPAFTEDCKNANDCLRVAALCADDVERALKAKRAEAVVFVGKAEVARLWQDVITSIDTFALDPASKTTVDQQLRDLMCQESLRSTTTALSTSEAPATVASLSPSTQSSLPVVGADCSTVVAKEKNTFLGPFVEI